MFQKNAQAKSEEKGSQDLEQRLSAYYGPALPPHPLPATSWLQLRAQLEQAQQETPREAGERWPGYLRARRYQAAPASFQQTFAALLAQVEYRRPAPDLCCRFSSRTLQPRVGVRLPGRGQVRLLLGARDRHSLRSGELEVLLAAGLARYTSASRPLFLCTRALFAAGLLLGLAVLPFAGVDRRYLWIFCLAFACCVAGACLISWQERTLAFRGDSLAARWLGRERVCQGLRLLAERGHPQRRPAWGEPSLAERIARVCGTSAKTKDKHLTLVG